MSKNEEYSTFRMNLAKMPAYAFFAEEIKNIVKSVAIESLSKVTTMTKDELDLYTEFYVSGIISAYLKWLKDEVNLPEEKVVNILGSASFYGFQQLFQPKQK